MDTPTLTIRLFQVSMSMGDYFQRIVFLEVLVGMEELVGRLSILSGD